MSETPNDPTGGDPTGGDPLGEVMAPTEQAVPDRREHAKAPARPDDDELARRTEQERVQAGVEDFDPDDVPSATE